MYDVEMIRIDPEVQKAPCVPMLPGAIPGAEVSLRTLEAGGSLVTVPVSGKAFIYLSIDGDFTFSAGEETRTDEVWLDASGTVFRRRVNGEEVPSK